MKHLKTIYIDVLVAVNIFIDFFLIICTRNFLHIKTPFYRLIIGSLIGGIFSLAALLPNISFIINILIDLFGASIIVFAAFGISSFKTYMKRTAVYFVFSFTFCGIMIGIYSAFRPKGMAVYNDVIYFNISPILLIILTLICYYVLYILKRILKGSCSCPICNVEIKAEDKSYTFSAKVDTGCNLKEPFSGNCVMVVEKSLISSYNPDESKLRIIPFNSLGGNGIIKGFKPEKIFINGKEINNDVYIGICSNILKGDIKALVPPEIIK